MGGAPAFESIQYVLQAVSHRRVEPGLLDVVMALFDGHDIPAMRWEEGRRPGYYKAPGMSRRLVFEAHLLGVVTAGAYPFRGVKLRCDCPSEKRHTCDGFGTRYVVLDLDAHNGETDTAQRCRAVMTAAWRLGLYPVVFSSRSGVGAHVFIFMDRPVTTRVAHAAGRHLALLAGVTERCDVIPSAEHYSGLGTLHALPLSPQVEAQGGGVLYDSHLRPVRDRRTVVGLLQWAHYTRSPRAVVESLARGEPAPPDPNGTGGILLRPSPRKAVRKPAERKAPTKRDRTILDAMRKRHPQFRRAIATPPEAWRGKRSSRDAYLAGYMRRQGMSPAGIVAALMELPETKAQDRGEDYAWALVEAQFEAANAKEMAFAGCELKPAEAKRQKRADPAAPWAARLSPPRSYEGGVLSPWWRESVQLRLSNARSNIDGIVLAYLIDRYYRGPMKRRMFFCGRRELGKALGMPARTVNVAVTRLAERFPDVLRVVSEVPHPRLRLASGFYVPEASHRDSVDWYVLPGRLGHGTLPCAHAGLAPGNGCDQPEHAAPGSRATGTG